jgi:hypothetical protein
LAAGARRTAAKQLGLDLARRWGVPAAIQAWTWLVEDPDTDDELSAHDRLRTVERDLQQLPDYPDDGSAHEAKTKHSVEMSLRIRRACLLWDTDRKDEALQETTRLLSESPWPASPMDDAVAMSGDASAPWPLYTALARFHADRNESDAADEHIAAALELLWREPDLWMLGDVLCSRVSTLAAMTGDLSAQRQALERRGSSHAFPTTSTPSRLR